MQYLERYKKRAAYAAIPVLALLLLVYAIAPVPDAVAGIFNGNAVDPYEIKSRLLMEAVNHTGVCTPQEAVKVWADGVKSRNGAMQYIVMDDALKGAYARSLESSFPNWVTGTSSPWVENYEITETSHGENSRIYTVRFKAATSAGPAGAYDARLSITRNSSFWQISHIRQSPGLQAFTGLQP